MRYRETVGIQVQVAMPVDIVLREFLNDTHRQAFLERELMGLGVDGFR